MHKRVRTLADLKIRLEEVIADEAELLEAFDKKRAEGAVRNFMRWNGTALHVAAAHADEARRLLAYIDEPREVEGVVVSDDEKFTNLTEECARQLLNMSIRLASRSSSPSANLDEDAARAFWIDLHQAFNGGY